MPNIPLYMAGQLGVNKDIPPEEIDPREWSDVRGVRFKDGKAIRGFGDKDVFGTPSGTPYWVMPVQAGSLALWAYSSLAKLFATDGATHAEVTRAVGGDYTIDEKRLWSGGTLSQIPVITNGTDVPQMWLAPAMTTDFENLSNWPAADRCHIIKPFKQFLIAMVVVRGGVTYNYLVKWSHPAVPGSVPSSWDETNPTLLAGETEILDELPGAIRDGLGLRDTFIIYKDNATWGMQFIGGNAVFRFFPIFRRSGIMSTHCVCEINSGAQHFVATGDDFIVHDGQNMRSVLTRRMRSFINKTLPPALIDYCFCVAKHGANEVWFCFPESGKFPTLAAVYNWQEETCTIRQLPSNISYADIGPIAATSDPWDADSATWDSDTTAWDLALFSAHFPNIIAANPTTVKLMSLDDEAIAASGYLERTGLALVGQDRVTGELKADNEAMKLVDRIWMKAKGGAFNVKIGSQEFMESPLVYEPSQLFTPGVDKYLDFQPVNGRFIAIRIDWQGAQTVELSGYDMNLEVLGKQ